MRYEIGNPSDKCFIHADEAIVATATICIIGRGYYFTKDENGESFPSCTLLSGDLNDSWREKFNITLKDFFDKPGTIQKIVNCLKTFEYAGERTSTNNIGKSCLDIQEQLEELLKNREKI